MKIHILWVLYSYYHQNTVLYNTLVLGVPIFLGTSSTKRWRPGDFTIEAVVSYPVCRDQCYNSARNVSLVDLALNEIARNFALTAHYQIRCSLPDLASVLYFIIARTLGKFTQLKRNKSFVNFIMLVGV